MDIDVPIVPPPSTVTADGPDRRPVLYLPDGTPMVKRPIGFDTGMTGKSPCKIESGRK